MGLIAKIKELFSAKRYILRVMEEADRRNAELAALNNDELMALSNDDLCSAILYRIDREIEHRLGKKPSEAHPAEALEFLGEAPRTVYILACWESLFSEGGLCHFLTGDYGSLAPYLPDALTAVGAADRCQLLEDFLTVHGIRLPDASISASNEFEYAEQKARYPYEEFDRAYAKLPSLEEAIGTYIRKNAQSF